MTSLPIRSSRVCSRSEFLLLRGDERSAELNWRGQLVDLGRGYQNSPLTTNIEIDASA